MSKNIYDELLKKEYSICINIVEDFLPNFELLP